MTVSRFGAFLFEPVPQMAAAMFGEGEAPDEPFLPVIFSPP